MKYRDKFNTPERTCARCNQTKSYKEFKPFGSVCLTCRPYSTQNTHRTCKHCGESKALEEFQGQGAVCKQCKNKTPERICTRCNQTHTIEKFAPNGKVCYQCKIAAMLNRDIKRTTAKRDYWQKQLDDLLKES